MCGCIDCKERNSCTRTEKKDFSKFRSERSKELSMHFLCNKTNQRCRLSKCELHKECHRPEKRNYERYKNAFQNNAKEELIRLTGGRYPWSQN